MIRKNVDLTMSTDAANVGEFLQELSQQDYAVHTAVTGFDTTCKWTLARDGKILNNAFNKRKIMRITYRYVALFTAMHVYIRMEE